MSPAADDTGTHPEPGEYDNEWQAERLAERQGALGQVIDNSATMEETLREVFCALMESKYAAVLAGGQTAHTLIEQCEALTNAHHDMPAGDREAIKAALNRCEAANQQRNHLVHGIKTAGRVTDGALQTIKSRRGRYTSDIRPWTLSEMRAAGMELLAAGNNLFGVMMNAVGPDLMAIDQALAWEDHRRQP